MGNEPIPDDEVLSFDANAALIASRRLWLMLGRQCASVVATSPNWLDDNKAAADAMEWAAQAEACFWRATGDMASPDVDKWVPALRATPSGNGGEG